MNPVLAFTIIMAVWTVSDLISKKTKSLLSSLFVASLIFLIGFKGNIFPKDILPASSLLPLGQTIVGFIIIHIGTMISLNELKKQWKTVIIGVSAVLGITAALFIIGPFLKDINYVIGAIGAVSGGTVSIIMVQEAAAAQSALATDPEIIQQLLLVSVFPVLIAAFQGLIGFPLTSFILRKEASRLKKEYRAGTLELEVEEEAVEGKKSILPEFLQTTAGTLFCVGVAVVISQYLSGLTGGTINTFIIALIFGIILRETGVFKPGVLTGIDAYGLMMLGLLIIIFGPLATTSVDDLITLIFPIIVAFTVGIAGNIAFSAATGKILGYSIPMSIAVGLTSLYGFPGTQILSQEAAASVGENEEEVKAIQSKILPKMIIAGFATVTITSVIITGIIVEFIH